MTEEATGEGPEWSGSEVGLQYPHDNSEDLHPRRFKALEGVCHEKNGYNLHKTEITSY